MASLFSEETKRRLELNLVSPLGLNKVTLINTIIFRIKQGSLRPLGEKNVLKGGRNLTANSVYTKLLFLFKKFISTLCYTNNCFIGKK